MGSAIVGFDFGESQMKLAVCDQNAIKKLISLPLPKDLVKDGKIVSFEAMSDTLKTVRREHRISVRRCAVILPAGLVFFRRLQMPQMSIDQLKLNLPYEFRDYITMDKDKYFYDYAICGKNADENQTLDLMAAAVPKQIIEEYTAMFRHAGFKLCGASPRESAFSNLIAMQPATESATEFCFLDIGYAGTRLYFYTGTAFEVTRVIDYGTAVVVRAVADSYHVDEHIAQTYLATNHEGAQSCESALNIYHTIAIEIMKAINFYRFSNPESKLHAAYYCGGGALFDPLIETVRNSVDLELHSVTELMPKKEDASVLCAAAAGIARL